MEPAEIIHTTGISKQDFSASDLYLKNILSLVGESEQTIQFQEFISLINQPQVDRMLGSLFGAFIGDSLGSYCEFTSKQEATLLENETMRMPGGGPFKLEAGQITDDSQMAIHLLTALLNYQTGKSMESQIPNLVLQIGYEYVEWKKSLPFDIGVTCRNGLSKIEEQLKDKTGTIGQKYERLKVGFENVSVINRQSLSNGFLMRITPLAILHSLLAKDGHFTEKDETNIFKRLIQEQNRMTHAAPICFQASTDYIQLISRLIRRPGFSEIEKISNDYETVAKQNKDQKSSKSYMLSGFQDYQKGSDYFMCATVHQGFFKIAYTYCFKILKQISSICKSQDDLSSDLFKSIMAKVIRQGGDTDTNACIVGGVIGSIVGFKKLPAQYLEKQLGLRLGINKSRRKSEKQQLYEPRNGFIKLIQLIKKFR